MTFQPTRRALLLAGVCACALGLSACEKSDPHAGHDHDHADHDHDGHDHAGHDHADHAADTEFVPFVATAESEGARWTYEDVLGVITAVPIEGDPASELRIHHEHIPDFVGWDGTLHINADGIPGMKSMTMPFTAEPESLLDGLSVGDKVQFTMKMDLEAKRYWISALTKLDESVELDYTNKPAPPMAPEQAP